MSHFSSSQQGHGGNTCFCNVCYCKTFKECSFCTIVWLSVMTITILGLAVVINTLYTQPEFELITIDPDPKFINPTEVEIAAWTKRFSDGLKIRTIAYSPGNVNNSALDEINKHIEDNYPNIHTASYIDRKMVNEHSVVYVVHGQRNTQNPYLLYGHLDVVQEGDRDGWSHDPFLGGVITDDSDGEEYIFGRGALDMKHTIYGILEALEHIVKAGEQPQRTFFIAFGHDEEVYGFEGAGKIKIYLEEFLNEHNQVLDFILDEGTMVLQGVMPGASNPVINIGVAEKGYVSAKLIVNGTQGHSSMPPRDNAIGQLARAIVALQTYPQPNQFGNGPEKDTLTWTAPFLSFGYKMIFSNMWLFSGFVSSSMKTSQTLDALQRTTTAVTIIEAGVKENIVPGEATAIINHRVHPGQTVQEVIHHDIVVIGDEDNIHLEVTESLEASPVSPYGTNVLPFQVIANSAKDVYPDASIAPTLLLGKTDSTHFVNFTKHIYRFTPSFLNSKDLSRFHGYDERISVKHYIKVVEFYHRIMKTADIL